MTTYDYRKRDTNRTGDISETAIRLRFLQLGYIVLTPYGGNHRCDLMIEDHEGKFQRIQCKTARLNASGTALLFHTSNRNVTGQNRQARDYRGQCDYFAVYCEKLHKVYLVPVEDVGIITACLWLEPTRKRGVKDALWAKNYEI